MTLDPENRPTEEGRPESSFQMFSKFDSNDGKWAESQTVATRNGFAPGQWIDRYLLVEKIGDGGMGEVWLAEQSEPIRREVALKLIRPERMTDRAQRRFKQERQTLALLDHPNICSILDAGTTDKNVPYLVMQRIEGQPITAFCDQNQLSIAERLTLFGQLCEAIQYAHQQGIYHRDIKPANVLVANIAGKPTVKVIDFGLSKASCVDWPLSGQLDLTREGEVIGTLRYLSPELASLGSDAIGPASEVYSLGIVLFELLVGRPPVVTEPSDSLGKYLDSVRSFESIRPSQLISESNEELDAILHRRNAKAESLIKVLKLDLDWVVLKAVKRNATLRYQSVQAMQEDIDRHLAGHPVSCRHSELGYQVQKLLRRNAKKIAWCTAAVCLASLSVWVGTQLGNPKLVATENSGEEATNISAAANSATDQMFAAEPPLTSRPPLFDRQAILRDIHTAKALASTQDLSTLDWEQCQHYQRLLLENGEVLTAEYYANELIRRSTASNGADSMTTIAARQQRARCWIVGGQLTDAQDELLQLLPLVSDEPDFSAKIAMDLAVAYEQSGRLDLAIKHLYPIHQTLALQNQTGSSISPTFLKCCQQLSNLHWKNGQLNLAIAWADEISQAVQSTDNRDWKFSTQCDLLAYRYAKDSTPENLLAFEQLLQATEPETTHKVLHDARRASTLMQIFDRRESLVFGKAIAPVFLSCVVSRNYQDKVLFLGSNLDMLPDPGEEFAAPQLKICISAFKRRLRSAEEALLVFDFFQSIYESSSWSSHRQEVSQLLQNQMEKYAQLNSGKNAATVALKLQLELCDNDWEQLPDVTIHEMHDQVVQSSGSEHWLAKKLRTHPAFGESFVQTSNQRQADRLNKAN